MRRRLTFLLSLLVLSIGLVSAQVSKVTGVVVSAEDGEPVIGASVLVVGTNLGTITDIDGKYEIANVPADAKHLRISYVGMETQLCVVINVLTNLKRFHRPVSSSLSI